MKEYRIQCERGTDRTEEIKQLQEEMAKVVPICVTQELVLSVGGGAAGEGEVS